MSPIPWTDVVPDGVPAAWVEDLRELLRAVANRDGLGAAPAAAIHDWVLLGDDATIPDGLVWSPDGGFGRFAGAAEAALCIDPYGGPRRNLRLRLDTALDAVPAPVGLRWATVLGQTLQGRERDWFPGNRLPDGALWPFGLLLHAGLGLGSMAHGYPRDLVVVPVEARTGVSTAVIDTLQQAAGWPPSTLLVALLTQRHGSDDDEALDLLAAYCHAPDLSAAALRHADDVKGAFAGRLTVTALRLACLLDSVDDAALAAYGDVVERMAAATGKQVSAAGRRLLLRLHPPVAEEDAEPDDEPARGPAPVRWAVEVTPPVRQAVLDVWRRLDTVVEERNLAVTRQGRGPAAHLARFTDDEVDVFLGLLAADDVLAVAEGGRGHRRYDLLASAVTQWPAVLPLSVAVSLLAYLGELSAGGTRPDPVPLRFLGTVRGGRPEVTLQDVADHLAPFGITGADVLLTICDGLDPRAAGDPGDWPDDAVAPLVAREAATVERLLRGERPGDLLPRWRFHEPDRAQLLGLVATLPRPPKRLVPLLLELSLGTATGLRAPARAALAALPDRRARIDEALTGASADVRSAAAGWLAELGDPAAVPGLEKALATEPKEPVRAALLDALEALGQDLAQYLDVPTLVARAAKEATKKLPAAMAWFDPATLPAVRWAPGSEHAGEPVPPEVLRLLAVDAVKAKDPTPNAVLRRYVALVDPRDRTALGARLLDAWLAEDLRPVDAQTAAKAAEEEADGWVWAMANWPQDYAKHPWNGWTKEQITAALLPAAARRPAGSATASKGLLALVGACGDVPDAARRVERYLKDHQGRRASQAKSLLAVLAMLDDPLATQTLLAVARRFRVQGIQEEAARLAERVAARRGWSVDELADRTIPTAGFDDDGRMTLSYGPRAFTAVVRPDLTVELLDPDGATLAALPAARASDDAELAAESRQAFTTAKKAVTVVVAQQTDRLHEALVGQRLWPFADWSALLAGHPLLRHVVQQLVWRTDAGVLFRPLDDGTLTDADDEQVTVAPDAAVHLAHDGVVSADDRDRWLTHLADYEVVPPFPQLGVPPYELTDETRTARVVRDVEGHVLRSFALRSAAGRRGWGRGAVVDGPFVVAYVKRFPGLRWEAELTYTGEELGEGATGDQDVALRRLSFHRIVPGRRRENLPWAPVPDGEPLGDVPPLLLAECVADVRAIAAEGDGFDPDWRRLATW